MGTAVALLGTTLLAMDASNATAVWIFIPEVAVSIYKSQIAFMGVARRAGPQPQLVQPYKFRPKSFTYVQTFVLTVSQYIFNPDGSIQSPSLPISVFQLITDYDFDLFEIRIVYQKTGLPSVICAVMLFDSVKQQTSNIPMLDKFWNGTPGTPYENGSVVPALLYPKQSQIRLDFHSLATPAILPIPVEVHFVGQNRFPCQ
jgi:hypothetical protein